MKILLAIQGTGNGHISRARDIYPELKKYGEVHILVSGYQADLDLPFPVTYRVKGLSFIFGRHGGVSLWRTLRRLSPWRFLKDVYHIPVEQYDLVVNDFEPVTAWAARLRKVPCFALSHQAAVVHPASPKPRGGWAGRIVLKYYAPFQDFYGFHFEPYAGKIFMPVIRKEVQQLEPAEGKHYTVYLPAYDDASLVRFLHHFRHTRWEVFSKHNKEAFVFENITVRPIANEAFLQSLAGCEGALLGAGFEGPAEALYLRKKLMVVPMKRQFEQQCNAAAMARLGVPVIHALTERSLPAVEQWLRSRERVILSFPRETAALAVHQLVTAFMQQSIAGINRSLPGLL